MQTQRLFHGETIFERTEGKNFRSMVACRICGKHLCNTTFAKASHGKVHVKDGSAASVSEWLRGKHRTIYVQLVNIDGIGQTRELAK